MAKNINFWKHFLSYSEDRKLEEVENKDALEEGLQDLSWFENRKRVVRQKIKKTQETFGEEIGNSITHGAMALFLLGMLPYAAVRAYIHAPAGKAVIDTLGISVFVICVYLMFLASTVYHSMKHGTSQKYIMNKIDHIMIYYAIAGTYTPICLSLVGGALGLGLCIAQWCLVIAGTLFKSLMFSKSKLSYVFTCLVYLLMGWMIVFCFGRFYDSASPVTFWLILAGGLCYSAGVFFFSAKYKFAHMVWHFFVDFGAICHFIALVYFMR